MLLDAQTQFSDKQALTATAVSTNYLDLGPSNPARNIGVGSDLYLVFQVTTAFVGAGATVTPSLQAATDAAFTSPQTVRTYDTLAALSAANTYKYYQLEPVNGTTVTGPYLRYIRVNYTVAGGTLTGGAISSFLVANINAWLAYADGYVIQ